jgi:hypothetical protein
VKHRDTHSVCGKGAGLGKMWGFGFGEYTSRQQLGVCYCGARSVHGVREHLRDIPVWC